MNDSLMYIIKVRRYHEPENRAMPAAKSSPKRWWLLILMLGYWFDMCSNPTGTMRLLQHMYQRSRCPCGRRIREQEPPRPEES